MLLLDEPTNHLDIRHQLSILQFIRKLPITVIIVLHDLRQAMMCDQIGILDKGKVIDVGRPNEVLTARRLQDTFGVHADFLDDKNSDEEILHFRSAVL